MFGPNTHCPNIPLEESMSNSLSYVAVCAVAVASLAVPASAQTPAPAQGTPNIHAVEKATYVTIPMEITINRPAAEVWKRIGKYCDIAEWLQIAAGCTITAGKDNEIGAVRSVAAEVLVGKSEFSYTYTQTVAFQNRTGAPYNLYHGTLEARPIDAKSSRLLYTLIYDNSMLADDAARAKDRAGREAVFNRALQNMKTLAEGGTLPPPPARGKK
jgi:hypothetical protein